METRSRRKRRMQTLEPVVEPVVEPVLEPVLEPVPKIPKYVLPQKDYIPTFTKRRRPNLAALHAQNVFLRPFNDVQARQARHSFERLCQKHIMVDNLDLVQTTTHMADRTTTVFLVGEIHETHTKCKSILEMFQELVAENKALPKPVIIDFIIELFEREIPFILKRKTMDSSDAQINHVRKYFTSCIRTRDCAVRVHWADPTQTKNKMPEWLYTLNLIMKPKDSWTDYPVITDVLRSEADLPLILTENQTVMKEIRRASEVNPKFTAEFALTLFDRIWQNMRKHEGSWQYKIWFLKRVVMDFYAIARIIRQKMKHVVFYCGDSHTWRIRYILQCLNFNIVALQDKSALPCAQKVTKASSSAAR